MIRKKGTVVFFFCETICKLKGLIEARILSEARKQRLADTISSPSARVRKAYFEVFTNGKNWVNQNGDK